MKKIKTVPTKIKTKNKPLFEQSRNYCFTDFEFLDYEAIYKEYKDIIRAIGIGVETCPTTKKQHIQGHIQFINKKRLNGVKNILGSKKIHLESCRGSVEQNIKYCSKDGKYQTFGIFISQGQRTDFEDIKKMIDEGASLKDIKNKYYTQFVRYNQGFSRHIQIVQEENSKKFRKLEVELVCGPTNTGKTRKAVEENPNAYKICGNDLKWFDGYNGHTELIIDEYANDVKITKLLNLLDGYQLRLDIKGSFTYANWTKVIITTNLRPSEIHSQANPNHLDALKRRITKTTNLYENLKCAETD